MSETLGQYPKKIDPLGRYAPALASANFRRFLIGSAISLLGTWMQEIAVMWILLSLTDSAFWLGVASFCSVLPGTLLGPVVGMANDRADARQVLAVAIGLEMVQSLILLTLVVSGEINIWLIVVLQTSLGLFTTFEYTARQTFLNDLFSSHEHRANAVALNSLVFGATRLVGCATAGLIIAANGEAICILFNAVSYGSMIITLRRIHVVPSPMVPSKEAAVVDISNGFRYALGFPPMRSILTGIALMSFFGASYSTLLPLVARNLPDGGGKMFGFLSAAAGVGTLAGGVFLSGRKTPAGLGRVIITAAALFGICLIGVSVSSNAWSSAGLLCGLGFAFSVHMTSSNMLLQAIADRDKFGFVMGLFRLALLGTSVGSLVTGSFAAYATVPLTLRVCGFACLVISLIFYWKLPPLVRLLQPIYISKGISVPVGASIAR